MTKSFVFAVLLFLSNLAISGSMNQFFRVEIRPNPCVGRPQLQLLCESKGEKHDFSNFSKTELPYIIEQSLPGYTGLLNCRYELYFEGDWCRVSGSFDFVFANGKFIVAKNINRSYWAE